MVNPMDINQQVKIDYEQQLNNLDNKYGSGKCGVTEIEEMANEMLATIPKLNRNQLRIEMSQMHVDVYIDPTTFNINEGLAKAQAYRERLAGILALADREFNQRTKVFEMLVMAHNVVSKASSADKRKGEAIMKYAVQFLQLEAAETFRNEVKTYLDNMRATSETISRQASVLQAQITLGEIRRKDNINTSFAESENALSARRSIEEFTWNN